MAGKIRRSLGNNYWHSELAPDEVVDVALETYKNELDDWTETLSVDISSRNLNADSAEELVRSTIQEIHQRGTKLFHAVDPNDQELLHSLAAAIERVNFFTAENEDTGLDLAQLAARWLSWYFAKDAVPNIAAVHERLTRLARMALPQRASPRVANCFSRLSRCVQHGLNAEAVIICRAVLESSLQKAVASTTSKDLAGLIRTASHCRSLSPEQVSDADDVRLFGNKVVHENQPVDDAAMWDCISKTFNVIGSL